MIHAKALCRALAVLVLAGSRTAAAQDGWKSDAFAGYSLVSADGEAMHGGHAAVGWGVWGPSVGLVLDVSVHQGRNAEGTDVSALSLMAGPRLTFGGRFRPHLHLIAGVVRTRAGVSIFDVEITESSTDLGGAAGGGIDVGFADRWAVRLLADYRVVRAEGETASDPRFSIGAVYRFGAR